MKHFWISHEGVNGVFQAKCLKDAILEWIRESSDCWFRPNVDDILKFETCEIKDIAEFEKQQNDGQSGPPLDECRNYYLSTDTVAWNVHDTVEEAQHSDPYFVKVYRR